jgi:hypothetical protein
MTANNHGRASTYVHHKCRCAPCTEANRQRHAAARARRREQEPPADAHGKDSTYKNWGCRCESCSAAHSVAMAHYNPLRVTRKKLDLKEAS